MKHFLSALVAILLIFYAVHSGLAASITANFPTSLDSWDDGDVIEDEDIEAIQQYLGITGSTSSSTITFKLNNALGRATTTINGLNGPNFTFATSGPALVISGSGATITFSIPTSTSATSGILSATDWTTFNSKAGLSDIYAPGFVTGTSTAFVTPATLYSNSFITATATILTSLTHVSTTNATTTNLRFGTATGTAVYFSADSTKLSTGATTISASILNATTTQTTNNRLVDKALTVSNFYCNTSGATVTLWAEERASSTPNTTGTALFSGAGIACDNDGTNTTSFNDSALAALSLLNVFASSTPNSTTTVNFTFTVKEQ